MLELPLAEALAMAGSGEIADGKTIMLLQWARIEGLARVLKEERQGRILDLLRQEGRRRSPPSCPAGSGSPGHTVRRDLEELAEAGALRRVHGGAVPRSPGRADL